MSTNFTFRKEWCYSRTIILLACLFSLLSCKGEENNNVDVHSESELIAEPTDSISSDIEKSQQSTSDQADTENLSTDVVENDTENQIHNIYDTSKEYVLGSLSNNWLFILLTFLLITTVVFIGVSLYLYRMKILMLNDKTALVPQKWGAYLDKVGKGLSAVNETVVSLNHQTQRNTDKLESMIDTYMQLQESLDNKDREIERLRNGYDQQIFKKFLNRFIRVDQHLNEILESNEVDSKDLEITKRLLEDAFLECGVERFNPKIGQNYLESEGIDENPEQVYTQDENKEYQIAEVMEEGYQLTSQNGYRVIIPAKVKIYTNQK